MHPQRKIQLDIFQFKEWNLGLYRDAFDDVEGIKGFLMKPLDGVVDIWRFKNQSGRQGRMMDLTGFLFQDPISLKAETRAYMITRQDYTLALLLPRPIGRLIMNEVRYKVMEESRKPLFPDVWPKEMISQVIRHRWKNIIILDESYLLSRIGLRKSR